MMSAAGRRIVVLNTGSSSLKFADYPLQPEAEPLSSGEVSGIGGAAHLKVTAGGSATHDAATSAVDPHAAMQRSPR
jgi:acetate kinase